MNIVNLKSAKILQKLGYKGEYRWWILADDTYLSIEVYGYLKVEKYPAPRIDDVAYWIIDKHHYFIDIRYESKKWYYIIINMRTDEVVLSEADKTSYKEALADGVEAILSYLNNGSNRKDVFKSART